MCYESPSKASVVATSTKAKEIPAERPASVLITYYSSAIQNVSAQTCLSYPKPPFVAKQYSSTPTSQQLTNHHPSDHFDA